MIKIPKLFNPTPPFGFPLSPFPSSYKFADSFLYLFPPSTAATTTTVVTTATTTVAVLPGETMPRVKPNVLITGTPGTGKTTMSSALAESTQFRHVNIGDLVRDKNLHDGWDQEFHCHIINEDLVCDELEDMMEEGGIIVDYHGCDFFPERWFDRVVVLQTENSILYDRLSKRGYTGSKLSNNIECEIFQVLLEEAKESYPEDIVVSMRSDSIEDITRNVAELTEWVSNWSNHPRQNDQMCD